MKSIALPSVVIVAICACACSTSNSLQEHTRFSKADSLTDTYLVLNDSLLQSWNRIVVTEIDKTRTLQELLEDLDNAHILTEELRESFQIRVEQLEKIRFNQQNIDDEQIVKDYDLAVQSLIDDFKKVASSPGAPDPHAMFRYLQENTMIHRLSYDSLAQRFNEFITSNKSSLKDLDVSPAAELGTRPLFVKVK